MKNGSSSFISEHTAEYILIPNFVTILKREYTYVTPIFPWLTREGGAISRKIHKDDRFRIVGLYPKRPKLNESASQILIKINREFIVGASEASKLGIPMIAGCPLATSFWNLDQNTKCIWIKLGDKTLMHYIVDCINTDPVDYQLRNKEEVFETDATLLHFIKVQTRTQDFNDLIFAVRKIKPLSMLYSFMGFGSYKPVFFLLKD